jgi:hypothetical protein
MTSCWFAHGRPACLAFRHRFATSTSALKPIICMAPSPMKANTGRSGCASLAASAYGIAHPMVARPPESDDIMPRRMRMHRASHTADVPESAVRIASSGSRVPSSHTTR